MHETSSRPAAPSHSWRMLCWFALASVLIPAVGHGVPLTVANPSFEEPETDPGTFITNAAPNNWNTYGNINFSGRVVGVVNPNDTTLYVDEVPHGENVGVTFFLPSFTNNEAGMQQTLADTLQPHTTYTLTVAVGNMAVDATPPHNAFNFNGFPGYRVDLLAGTTVLASDNNTLLPGEGRFLTSTVQFTTGASHPNAGEALGIRLVNLDSAAGIEVNFDDVDLDAAPVPSPTETAAPTATQTPEPTPTDTAEPTASATPTEATTVGACPATPPPSCKTPVPQRGSLALAVNPTSAAKSNAKWSWNGEETLIAEFGAPTATTNYRVCFYDGSGDVFLDAAVAAGSLCSGKPCWRELKSGISYRDRYGTSGGLTSLALKAGVDGRASVKLKAKGALLTVPSLPLTTSPNPVAALVVNEETGTCWSASFSTPLTAPDNDRKWKARND